jgi:hypothetical protein
MMIMIMIQSIAVSFVLALQGSFVEARQLPLSGSLRGGLAFTESTTEASASTTSRNLWWFTDVFTNPSPAPPPVAAYHSITDVQTLGATNFDAAVGNPLKGLLTSPRWVGASTAASSSIPSTLEFYYIGLDEIMTGWNQFDWSVLDQTLRDAAARKKHVIWRVYCHYPGQRLRIPPFLLTGSTGTTIKLVNIADGVSPQYDDPLLLKAFEQFIAALGQRYDGHKSIAFLQQGLLGKWGEWHTYPENGLLSDATKDKVMAWFVAAFPKTRMQIRTPRAAAYAAGVGYHDDSFAYSTVDGAANGNQNVGWFFWSLVKKSGGTAFWQRGVMGGETRPELQDTIFQADYAAGTPYQQDFMTCVKTTHASYLLHNAAFQNGGYTGVELSNALYAHARMGYNFRVNEIGAFQSPTTQELVVGVKVEQIGVAPFYYPLGLVLSCDGYSATAEGVEKLVEEGEENWFYFHNVPAVAKCLAGLQVSLSSDLVYSERPIKFAQGSNGKVAFSLPLPNQGLRGQTKAPVSSPVATPTQTASISSVTKAPTFPASRPTRPVAAPSVPPTTKPAKSPTASPTLSPTEQPTAAPVKSVSLPTAPKSFWEILFAWLRMRSL